MDKELSRVLKKEDPYLLKAYFKEQYNQYYKLVCFVISKYVNNKEDIEDLANDTFIKVFNNVKEIQSSFKYYLIQSANNIAKDYLKKKRFDLDNNDTEVSIEDNSIPSLNYLDLIKKMEKHLKQIEIDIILMHVIEGYTFKEIAEHYNFKEKKVISIYYQATKKFLKEEGNI